MTPSTRAARSDVTRLVADGYDSVAGAYTALGERSGWGASPEYLAHVARALPRGSRVLDLGCGAGVPVTAALADAHRVVAVDVSAGQLALVGTNAPAAGRVRADIGELRFPESCFDAVVCFYSLTHVPREQHLQLLSRIAGWLLPGGLAVLTMGAGDHPGSVGEDFLGLGVPMFVSHFDAATNRALVEQAGLGVVRADVREQEEDGRRVRFCWVVAERPG